MSGKSQSRAHQRTLLAVHPRREEIQYVEDLVRERTIDVVGTLAREKWADLVARLVMTDPSTLADELATAVAEAVSGILASDPDWPNGPKQPVRQEEVVLTRDEVANICNCFWYQNAAQFAQFRNERNLFPGWTYDWVLVRLRRSGAVTIDGKRFNGHLATPDLDYVVVRLDGSTTAVFEDGRVVEQPAIPDEERLTEVVSRANEPDHTYGHYPTAEQMVERIRIRRAATN